MNDELTAIRDVWSEKVSAHSKMTDALGRAKIAESKGEDATADWDVVMTQGKHGIEGEREKVAVQMADDYVYAHPNEFVIYENMSLEECVKTLEVFRENNMDEQMWRVQVWLWHHFEPQHVGGRVKARIRIPGRN